MAISVARHHSGNRILTEVGCAGVQWVLGLTYTDGKPLPHIGHLQWL